jgi:hypothetical protein
MKSKPTGKSSMSYLSRASDSAVMDVTWHRRVAMVLLPNTNSLDAVVVLGCALYPRNTLLIPVSNEDPALAPKAVLR